MQRRLIRTRLKLLLAFLPVLIIPSPLLSQTFSGRVTSSFYAFEGSDSTTLTSGHARGYQAFQFDLGGSNVVFRTYGQLDNDFNTRLAGDGKVRIYNFYLE
ncbi:MAG: hypothetical protein ONB44_19840 [candidate division KSB1 bacterium]|nr:hypothetical protein [candidate division KSB1 bacterium]MDZ7304382.1 hypothetical protein [candidate division KSB1 bacterium]MDZ7313531.1 hypothetical protein [candidate division KSB1 bacterium]